MIIGRRTVDEQRIFIDNCATRSEIPFGRKDDRKIETSGSVHCAAPFTQTPRAEIIETDGWRGKRNEGKQAGQGGAAVD